MPIHEREEIHFMGEERLEAHFSHGDLRRNKGILMSILRRGERIDLFADEAFGEITSDGHAIK